MRLGEWRPGAACGAEEWQRHLAAVDRAFGNVVERRVPDVERLLGLADASAWESFDDAGTLVAVALAVPAQESLVRVMAGQPARAALMASGVDLVKEHVRGGAPLWVTSNDAVAAQVAERHGMALSYRDLQMRIPTAAVRDLARPAGTRLRDFDASPTALKEVHDLVCRAWGVAGHWPEFMDRFGGSLREKRFWILVESSQGDLLAACIGDVQELGDGRFGVVRHLDVAPSARRRGLGSWALSTLVRRFADAGQVQAQLGVHEDNRSSAPALYAGLGWRVVSSQDTWTFG